jgi:hypothetical protein
VRRRAAAEATGSPAFGAGFAWVRIQSETIESADGENGLLDGGVLGG